MLSLVGLPQFIVLAAHTCFTLISAWPFLLQGQDCDVPIHACINNPCKHGGTCDLKEGEKDGFWQVVHQSVICVGRIGARSKRAFSFSNQGRLFLKEFQKPIHKDDMYESLSEILQHKNKWRCYSIFSSGIYKHQDICTCTHYD